MINNWENYNLFTISQLVCYIDQSHFLNENATRYIIVFISFSLVKYPQIHKSFQNRGRIHQFEKCCNNT